MAATARQTAETARAEIGGLTERAGQRMRETVDQRSGEVASQMTSAAGAVRQAGTQLREQGSGTAANVVEAVADRAERLGSYMQVADADRMLHDVESFARNRPWLVAGAAAAAGFLASRLLKASSRRRYESGNGSRQWSATGVSPGARHELAQGGGYGGASR
jgi:ElaB/YqjD/DUF883 family membrane-anchored ribosome-binding protein